MKPAIRVVCAMSGGVDSSVAAALLKQQGYEVVGITMCFNLKDPTGRRPGCCSREGIEDARRVADKLEIRHYVINMQKHLEEKVIRNFCREYAQGRTPNPCVRCNQYIKFDVLLKKSLALGASFLATGHYARILKAKNGYELRKAVDPAKDQSYFLYRLKKQQLKHLLFPIGGLTKDVVRKLAGEFSLPVADKPDSQDVCFLPDSDYRGFLARRVRNIKPGDIVDAQGRVLGRHKGAAFYTIGQREGLGISCGHPLYVNRIDRKKNLVVVGGRAEALARKFSLKEAQFSPPLKKKVALKVKIRYNQKEVSADVAPVKDKITVSFIQPQFAVTPGQSAVFYRKDQVIGGGIIDEVLQ